MAQYRVQGKVLTLLGFDAGSVRSHRLARQDAIIDIRIYTEVDCSSIVNLAIASNRPSRLPLAVPGVVSSSLSPSFNLVVALLDRHLPRS